MTPELRLTLSTCGTTASHAEIPIDHDGTIGGTDAAGVQDIILESKGQGQYHEWSFALQGNLQKAEWSWNMSYVQSKSFGPIAPPLHPVENDRGRAARHTREVAPEAITAPLRRSRAALGFDVIAPKPSKERGNDQCGPGWPPSVS